MFFINALLGDPRFRWSLVPPTGFGHQTERIRAVRTDSAALTLRREQWWHHSKRQSIRIASRGGRNESFVQSGSCNCDLLDLCRDRHEGQLSREDQVSFFMPLVSRRATNMPSEQLLISARVFLSLVTVKQIRCCSRPSTCIDRRLSLASRNAKILRTRRSAEWSCCLTHATSASRCLYSRPTSIRNPRVTAIRLSKKAPMFQAARSGLAFEWIVHSVIAPSVPRAKPSRVGTKAAGCATWRRSASPRKCSAGVSVGSH